MKKVIREVKDFAPLIMRKRRHILISMFIAFLISYVPVVIGTSILQWLLFYLMSFILLYIWFRFFNKTFITYAPTADIKLFLINQGKDVDFRNKWNISFINTITGTITFICKDTNNKLVKYRLYVKNNYFKKL